MLALFHESQPVNRGGGLRVFDAGELQVGIGRGLLAPNLELVRVPAVVALEEDRVVGTLELDEIDILIFGATSRSMRPPSFTENREMASMRTMNLTKPLIAFSWSLTSIRKVPKSVTDSGDRTVSRRGVGLGAVTTVWVEAGANVGVCAYSSKRRITRQAFCPPNPKLLDRTTSTF